MGAPKFKIIIHYYYFKKANEDYIAHSEPLCKSLNILKIPDIYTCSLWKCYYKLSKNQLPIYFDVMIPMLPNICNMCNIRHLTFHLPLVKHDFAEQRLDYQLIKLLNTNESTARSVHT